VSVRCLVLSTPSPLLWPAAAAAALLRLLPLRPRPRPAHRYMHTCFKHMVSTSRLKQLPSRHTQGLNTLSTSSMEAAAVVQYKRQGTGKHWRENVDHKHDSARHGKLPACPLGLHAWLCASMHVLPVTATCRAPKVHSRCWVNFLSTMSQGYSPVSLSLP
jgi:hypothetical protein